MNDDQEISMTVIELKASMLLAVAYSSMLIASANESSHPTTMRQMMEKEIDKIIQIAIDRKRE